MTIALGLSGNDGLVLGADMQRTIGGYIKTYDGKVDTILYHEHEIVLAIAGAGTGDYIETAKQVLLENFPEELNKRKRIPMATRIPSLLKERFLKFFDEHIARWAYFPEQERPSVELLIGITGKGLYPRLFHCDGTAFHETYKQAIGSGVILADELLLQYTLKKFTIQNLGSLAVYILQKVKRGVDGCGGPTHIVGLRKGFDFAFTDHKQIKEMENSFEELDRARDKATTESVCEKPLVFSWLTESKKEKQVESS